MRSKAPLALIEQVFMLLVFALAAVLCLRAFVWADTASKRSVEADQALLQAQSAAETLKSSEGDFSAAADRFGGIWDGENWLILYDEQWHVTEDMHTYTLRCAREEDGLEYLGMARVEVLKDEVPLASLEIAWQEVGDHG